MPDAEETGGNWPQPPAEAGTARVPARGRPGPRIAAAVLAILFTVLGGGWLIYGVGIVGWACSYGSTNDLCGGGAARIGEATLGGGGVFITANIVLMVCVARVGARQWWRGWWIVNGLAVVTWGIAMYLLQR